jgi:hypothetical protein
MDYKIVIVKLIEIYLFMSSQCEIHWILYSRKKIHIVIGAYDFEFDL